MANEPSKAAPEGAPAPGGYITMRVTREQYELLRRHGEGVPEGKPCDHKLSNYGRCTLISGHNGPHRCHRGKYAWYWVTDGNTTKSWSAVYEAVCPPSSPEGRGDVRVLVDALERIRNAELWCTQSSKDGVAYWECLWCGETFPRSEGSCEAIEHRRSQCPVSIAANGLTAYHASLASPVPASATPPTVFDDARRELALRRPWQISSENRAEIARLEASATPGETSGEEKK